MLVSNFCDLHVYFWTRVAAYTCRLLHGVTFPFKKKRNSSRPGCLKKKGNDEKMFLIKKKIYTKKKNSKKKVTRETQLRNVHCSYFSSPVEDKTTILRLLNVLICPHSFFVHRRLWFIRPPTLPLRVHTCPGERLYLRHHQWLMGSWQSFLLFHWRPL